MKKKNQNIKLVNENIISFLEENYLFEDKTNFGILITGEWGCGKTFLLKKISEKYGHQKDKKFIYISLYGMKEIYQLANKLYDLSHPVLTSKSVRTMIKILKATASATTKFSFQDNDKNKADEITFSLPTSILTSENKEQKIKSNRIYIVDDIERCEIPPQEIFGYFSNSIIDENAKIIFICNEEELKKRISGKSQDEVVEYERQKEKIISMEFYVKSDKDAAINFFIEDYKLEKYKDFLFQNTKKVMYILDYNNLRTIQQAFFYLRIIFNAIAEYDIFENVYNDLVVYFLVLFIAKSKGELNDGENNCKNNISKSIKSFNNIARNLDNEFFFEVKEPAKIPMLDLFPDMIFKGDFSTERISKAYLAITNPKDDKTLYLSSMQANWRDFDDEKFKMYYNELKKQLKNGSFESCTQLWNFSELFLDFIKLGIIPDTQQELEDEICSYLKKYAQKIKPDILPDEVNEMLYYDDWQSSMNHSKKLIDSLCDFSLEKIKKNEEYEVKNTIGNKNASCSDIIKILEYNYNPDFPNCSFSTFDFVSIDEFFNKIISFSYSEQKNIFSTVKKICGQMANSYNQLDVFNKMVNAIKTISELYSADCEKSDRVLKPSVYIKEQLAQKYKKLYEDITTSRNC